MPLLHVLKGANPGANVSLETERFVIGRNPDCGIVIPITSVSREHAHIMRVQGKFVIEDLQSRNGTFVNNQAISEKTTLRNNDRIRICDFVAVFLDKPPVEADDDDEPDGGDSSSSSTVEATMSHNSNLLLETQPAEKLRGLLEISASLSKTLALDALLPKIVDSLFALFKQADRAFLILTGDENKLLPKVVKTRRPQDESTARFSRSIVRQCLEAAQALLSDDASQDNRLQLSQSVVDFRIRSVMCVPMVNAQEKAFGVIQLDTQDRAKKFTKSDLELLCGVANQASIALDNARMHADAVAQERMKRDLQLAYEVELSFLPQKLPELAGYEFHAFYRPAYSVGGDYYDFIQLLDKRLVMTLGDVAGKGVPAALLMAKLSADARYCFLTQQDPAKAVGMLNDLLAVQCARIDRFVTMAACVIDPATHIVTMVNAGHPSPLLCQADGTIVECVSRKVSGLALGIMEGYPFESCQIALQPGDSLLLYSDGISEAENVRGVQFETANIINTLKGVAAGSPKVLIDKLLKAVEIHTAGAKQNDDITMASLGRSR